MTLRLKFGRKIVGLALASFSMSLVASAQDNQSADEISTAAIKAATTDENYLTPWVSSIPDHPTVQSPRDFLGYIAGAPGELTHVTEIHAYMKALAGSSDRAKVINLGQTAEGRDTIAIIIADPQTLGNLEDYRGRLNALADPRKTSEAEANKIIESAKPIYWITAGLHSTELGPPETAMELAYRLIVDEGETFKAIRANVITVITPVFEVDGRTRSVEWQRKHQKGQKDYYNRPPSSPPFWGKYTFHDNNRDGIAMTQPLSKNYLNAFMKWKPTLSLDLHESVPLLYVSTGTGPYNTGVSPTTVAEWSSIANYEVSRLTAMGLPGVWTWGFYTGWYPGYMLWVTNNHNSHGRFFETFGNGNPETMKRDLGDSKYAGDKVVDRTWYRAKPPEEEVLWSMRNNVNYMQSGVIASLEYASRNGKELLSNFYTKGIESINIGKAKAPYAYVIKEDQRDRGAARELVDLLIMQGIEVSVASGATKYGDVTLGKGDAVIKLDQPYGPFARTLLEKQKFPEDVKWPPYDDIAWTLGYLRGVDVKAVDDKKILDHPAKMASNGADVFLENKLAKSAKYWAIAHKGQEGLGELRFALAGAKMMSAKKAVKVGRVTYPAGSIFIDASTVDRAALKTVLSNTLLEATSVKKLPKEDMIDIDVPRIAMLHSWISTQDPGWLRYTLDQSGVPYTLLEKSELKQGDLGEKYDVIIAPSFGRRGSLKALLKGHDKKWSPLAYETTEGTPSHGHIVSSPDITGGYGFDGMAAIEAFINDGGTFIGLGSGGSLVAESGIASDIGMSRPSVNTPGSVITMKITEQTSPLTFGYDEITYAFRGNTPFYTVSKDNRDLVVAQFGLKATPARPWNKAPEDKGQKADGKKSPLVLSGAILKGKMQLDGAPALLEKTVGKGQVILFGWNPMHRHLNHHDHAFVYNALMYWNDLK